MVLHTWCLANVVLENIVAVFQLVGMICKLRASETFWVINKKGDVLWHEVALGKYSQVTQGTLVLQMPNFQGKQLRIGQVL